MYKAALDALSAKTGAWFTQEQVGEAIGTTPKRAQAILSKLVAEKVVEREKQPAQHRTVGRFVHRVRFPVDTSKVALLNGHLRPKLSSRVVKEKARQGQLPLSREDAIKLVVDGVVEKLKPFLRPGR